MKAEELKLIVQDKYTRIARQRKDQDKRSCCCSKELPSGTLQEKIYR